MKKIINSTVLLVINSDYAQHPRKMLDCLIKVIPGYMQEYFNQSMELHESGARAVIMLNKESTEMLCGLIASYLQEVCINEDCNAWDERFLIQVIDELNPTNIYNDVLQLLKDKVEAHVRIAQSKFDGDLNFHRRSNVEVSYGMNQN